MAPYIENNNKKKAIKFRNQKRFKIYKYSFGTTQNARFYCRIKWRKFNQLSKFSKYFMIRDPRTGGGLYKFIQPV